MSVGLQRLSFQDSASDEMIPGFFRGVYTDLINGPKTEQTIEAALKAIDGYLEERAGKDSDMVV